MPASRETKKDSKSHTNMTRKTSAEAEYFSPVRRISLYPEQGHSSKERTSFQARKSTNSSREVFRLKVIHNDGGIIIDAKSKHTITDVMEIVCSEWLNILRDGDGSLYAHSWSVRGPPLTSSENIYLDRNGDRRTRKWRSAHEACEKSKRSIPANEKLRNIEGLDKGQSLNVVYGVERSTKFEIKAVRKYIPEHGCRLPRRVPSKADKLGQRLLLYSAPKFCPNLDDIFPNANKAMFGHGNRWICPYPTSPTNGGFICGEFQRCYDVLFLPYRSSSLHEALVNIDTIMMKYPEYIGTSSSRIGLPVDLTFAREAKLKQKARLDYLQEPGWVSRIDDLIPNKKFIKFLHPHNGVVSRMKEHEVREYTNFVAGMFPLCSKWYGKGLWASYRNQKVIIGEGNDRSGELRGVPTKIYAEISYKVKSLHEFFCVCETLFQRGLSREVTELDGKFGSLRV